MITLIYLCVCACVCVKSVRLISTFVFCFFFFFFIDIQLFQDHLLKTPTFIYFNCLCSFVKLQFTFKSQAYICMVLVLAFYSAVFIYPFTNNTFHCYYFCCFLRHLEVSFFFFFFSDFVLQYCVASLYLLPFQVN